MAAQSQADRPVQNLADGVDFALHAHRRAGWPVLAYQQSNVVQYTPQGLVVTQPLYPQSGRTVFAVGDWGLGIAESNQLRISQPDVR